MSFSAGSHVLLSAWRADGPHRSRLQTRQQEMQDCPQAASMCSLLCVPSPRRPPAPGPGTGARLLQTLPSHMAPPSPTQVIAAPSHGEGKFQWLPCLLHQTPTSPPLQSAGHTGFSPPLGSATPWLRASGLVNALHPSFLLQSHRGANPRLEPQSSPAHTFSCCHFTSSMCLLG